MFRSPAIPTETNRRKHWRAEVEDSGYFTVAYWTSEQEHRHNIMGVMCFGHPNRARAVTLPHHDVPGLKTIARAYSLWSMNRRMPVSVDIAIATGRLSEDDARRCL